MVAAMAQTSKINDITIVELDASYDSLEGQSLAQASAMLLELAQNCDPPIMMLDMSATRFIGSEFLELIFRVWRRLAGRQGQMVLCNVYPYCQEVLKITGLANLWPSYATRDEACAALAPGCAS